MSRNILRNFINSVELDGSFNILKTKNNGNWNWTSREKLLNNVNGCSKVLKDLNIKKGDRVAFKGKNSIEWLSWNLATYSVGGDCTDFDGVSNPGAANTGDGGDGGYTHTTPSGQAGGSGIVIVRYIL